MSSKFPHHSSSNYLNNYVLLFKLPSNVLVKMNGSCLMDFDFGRWEWLDIEAIVNVVCDVVYGRR